MIALDMDMPKSCWGCKFNGSRYDDRCIFTGRYTDDPYFGEHTQGDLCPLKQIEENTNEN